MSSRRKSSKRTNKSLRKVNVEKEDVTVSSLLSAGNVQEEEEDTSKILFVVDGERVCLDPLNEFNCVAIREENENKVPAGGGLEESEQDVSVNPPSHHHLTAPSTPLKRVSPLSPAFQENVQQSQSVAGLSQVETMSPLAATPKSLGSRRRRKRLRIYSETDSEVQEEESVAKRQKQRHQVTTPSLRAPKSQTSQKKIAVEPTTSDVIALPVANFRILEDYKLSDADPMDPNVYLTTVSKSREELCQEVQYEMDEQDVAWLEDENERRAIFQLPPVRPEEMELLLDRFEKEQYFDMQNSGMMEPGDSEEDAVCCICLDGESDNSNQIIFCDMCNIPVHQDCYGVPFIPEGSYLCRRCTISPNAPVECIFCPNKDGAFKQTVDGRWAHVLCALWIPEVRFSNPSLVEPVDDIDDIPASRWKLNCYLCKQKGVGACIQCLVVKACYTAFHVTCGQAAGYRMKMESSEDESIGVKLLPSCDKHTDPRERETTMKKVESINKVINEKKSMANEFSYPRIAKERIQAAFGLVNFHGKLMFILRLYPYWKIKRKSRSGAPLIRNLDLIYTKTKYPPQPSPLRTLGADGNPLVREDTPAHLLENMKKWREDLGKLQETLSNIRTESEQFLEKLAVENKTFALKIAGTSPIYQEVIKKLDKKDTRGIFFEPVQEEDAPGYFEVITKPMDLSTMEKKANEGQYKCLDDLEADFNLMISNCMEFNDEDSMFHKIAVKMKEHGDKIFQSARLKVTKKLGFQEFTCDLKPSNVPVKSEGKTEIKTKLESPSLQTGLNDLLDRLVKYDKQEIFSEPVDPNEVPEYSTIIKNPMDFSTMRTKISTQQYSCVEDLEADFFLMVDNCMTFNDDDTTYYKMAMKMKKSGSRIFEDVKSQLPSTLVEAEAKEITKEEPSVKIEPAIENDEDGPNEHQIMADVLLKLIAEDDNEVFTEPVSLEDVPDYLSIIQSPMDFSLMQEKLNSDEYSSLTDLEDDFNLMIDNCKRFNGPRTKYYKIAVALKEVADGLFENARQNRNAHC